MTVTWLNVSANLTMKKSKLCSLLEDTRTGQTLSRGILSIGTNPKRFWNWKRMKVLFEKKCSTHAVVTHHHLLTNGMDQFTLIAVNHTDSPHSDQ